MSDRLNQYFCMVSNFNKTTDPVKRRILLTTGFPNLIRTTASARLREQIAKFIKDNTDGQQDNQRAG